MAIAITLIICATILGCVFFMCVYGTGEDVFKLSSRIDDMNDSLKDIDKSNKELKSAIKRMAEEIEKDYSNR